LFSIYNTNDCIHPIHDVHSSALLHLTINNFNLEPTINSKFSDDDDFDVPSLDCFWVAAYNEGTSKSSSSENLEFMVGSRLKLLIVRCKSADECTSWIGCIQSLVL
jgi:hypothetical protein